MNRRGWYDCDKCCDTGCVLDPEKPVLVTEADGLVNCPYCTHETKSNGKDRFGHDWNEA